ncbi:MAG: M56 family metallopeptidase [Candidatus Sulfopaludibacter sp.]|nr:M56 family metallopeptidase [Candidatus Sulfopaludibacter sp.]
MMLIWFLGEWVVRSSLLILSGAWLLWLLRIRSPSFRLTAWTAILAGSLMIPVLARTLPDVRVSIPRRAAGKPAAVPGAAIREPVAILPPAVAAALTAVPTPPRPGNARRFDWARLAAILYVLVVGTLLLRIAIGLCVSLGLRRRSRPLGIRAAGFDVRESDGVASPVTLGVLRPAVLLPSDWREWNSAKLGAVIAHERSHIRRHDPAVQLISAIHRALLWANPLSWLLDRSIVRTAEQISDDDAVAVTRDRVSYAEILLEFVQRSVAQTNWPGVPMARYDRPDKRIRRVLNATAIPRQLTPWSMAGILTLAAPLVYLAAAAHPQSASPAPAPPEPVRTVAAQSPRQEQGAAAQLPAFEVASIKPADRNSRRLCCITIHPGARVDIHALSLKTLVTAAFRLSSFQVSGGDAWTEQDEYDIEAKPPEALRSSIKTLRYTWYGIEDEHLRQMLQALLIDRFQLKFHRETRTGDVYVMARSARPLALRPTEIPQAVAGLTSDDGSIGTVGYAGARWGVFNTSMPQLAKFASDFVLHVPVLDRTKLSGPFDYRQRQPDLEPTYSGDQSDSFLRFLQEAGLKLERTKGPVEYFVIDRAARPAPN